MTIRSSGRCSDTTEDRHLRRDADVRVIRADRKEARAVPEPLTAYHAGKRDVGETRNSLKSGSRASSGILYSRDPS